jgi:hypothetical protein
MTTSGAQEMKPKSEVISHAAEKSMGGAIVDPVQPNVDDPKGSTRVRVGPEKKSGDCDEALMRTYNR